LLMACRQLGSRIKKSVVFVEVAGTVGVYDVVGRRKRTCLDYGLDDGLKYCVQHGLSFLINIVEPCDQQVHS
jgi:hypothetical protein